MEILSSVRRRSGLRRALHVLLLLLAFLTFAIAPANIVLAAAAIVWIVVLSRGGGARQAFSSPAVMIVSIFVALLVLSAIFSLQPWQSLWALKGIFTFLLVPMFAYAAESEADCYAFIDAIGVAAVGLAFIGVGQYLRGGDDLQHRISATLSHYMTFSGLLLLVALFYLGVALEGVRGRRAPSTAIAVLLATAILLTFTRNAYVGFFSALLLFLALRRPRWILSIPVLAAAAYGLSPPGIRHRLLSTFDPSDPTNRDRLDMAVAGFRMIRDFPVFGIGLQLVKPYYPLYRVSGSLRWRVPHLHDNLIQIAAQSGIFAALTYAALIVLTLCTTWRLLSRETDPRRRGLLAGTFLAIAGITFAGFFEYNFGDVEVLMTTLIILSIPFSRAFRNENAAA